ncbi:MAG: sulfatase [Alphaproteobacteria bacterium]|nr:sulfatase [Alphaproteobacteria bacterium]
MTRRRIAAAALGLTALAASTGGLLWWRQRGAVLSPAEGDRLVRPIDPTRAAPGAPVDGPSVVLVIGCTLRKDILSPWGGDPALTPTLARLAAEGAVFDDAITAAPWTRPGHTAVLTGQHPAAIGMVEDGDGINSRVLAPEVRTLAEAFHEAGYTTLGLTANPNINALFGFAQGFDAYYEASGLWRSAGTVKTPGATMVDQALAMLDEREQQGAFYLQLTLVDAHAPYDTDLETGSRLAPPGAPVDFGRLRGDTGYFDASLQRLLDGLAARGLDGDDLIFVVVNDHGEGAQWPAHHEVEHGFTLYESVVGMPWLVWGGPVAAGHRIDGLASQVDVLPTLTALAGLSLDAPYTGPGHDFSAQLRGEGKRTDRGRAWSATWFRGVQRAAVFTEDRACVDRFATERRNRAHVPLPACFDRAADPGHATPLDPRSDGDAALLVELRRWHAGITQQYESWPHTTDAVIDQDLSDQLRALGYISE